MNVYNQETLLGIFADEAFLEEYNKYTSSNEELAELKLFINSLQLNKKYFRLEMNKKQGPRKKATNMTVSGDTQSIKEINSLLNKLTDGNFLKIRGKIKLKLTDKDYLSELIIENILQKCIVHTSYIPIYIELIQYLYSDTMNSLVEKLSDKIFDAVSTMDISHDSEYMTMCDKNKRLDKLIGHSILITELEKTKIVCDKIQPILKNFIAVLSECENIDEKYKCVQCLYNILKSYYGECRLPNIYLDELNVLISTEKSNKIKYKMMDIVERK
jgi:hypothetical protein